MLLFIGNAGCCKFENDTFGLFVDAIHLTNTFSKPLSMSVANSKSSIMSRSGVAYGYVSSSNL